MVHINQAEPRKGRLWAYGVASVAEAAKVGIESVRRAIRKGTLQMDDICAVAAWIRTRADRHMFDQIAKRVAGNRAEVVAAVARGEFDIHRPASVEKWIAEVRSCRTLVQPPPLRYRYFSLIHQRPQELHHAGRDSSITWTKARTSALVNDLRSLGFTNASLRGANHVYIRPDIFTLSDANYLVIHMSRENWTASDLRPADRRRLAVFGGMTRSVARHEKRRRQPPKRTTPRRLPARLIGAGSR
jgi:hypothetical protein